MEDPAQSGGLARALRSLTASLVAMAYTRAELAAVEMREAAQGSVRIALLALAGAVCAVLTLAFAGAFVVLLWWDTHRVAAMAAVLAVYAIVALATLARAVTLARSLPRAFDETRRTLAADRELFKTPA
jgi:uncharacterized membrane protein YqjE